MKRIATAALAAFFVASTAAASIFDKVHNTVAIVNFGAGGNCTAFHVGGGYYATANHCYYPRITSLRQLETILTHSGVEHKAVLISRHGDLDLAVLYVEGAAYYPKAELRCNMPAQVGEDVIGIGSPRSYGIMPFWGRVASINPHIPDEMKQELFSLHHTPVLLDRAITPGVSGGPVVDVHGRVIGISAFTDVNGGLSGISPVYGAICDTLNRLGQRVASR